MIMTLVNETTFVAAQRVIHSKLITTNTARREVREGKVIPQSYTIIEYLLTLDEVTCLDGEGFQPEACSSVLMMRDKIAQVLWSIFDYFLNFYS